MDIFRIVCLGLVQGILFFGSSMADDDAVPDSATPVKFDFAQWCKVGDHKLVLEKITLADVSNALGGGVVRRLGNRDDADLEWVLDFTDGSHLIRFESYGDMGGENHDLEGVQIGNLKAGGSVAKFPMLRLPISFQFASIGMSLSSLEAALGPAVKANGTAWYKFSGKRPIKVMSGQMLDYDVLATLRLKIVSGNVAAIQLTHVSSY